MTELQQRPALFTPGQALFWGGPDISEQMFAAQLDARSDAASRHPQIIDREVAWLIVRLQLDEGTAVLDLRYSPGLYTSWLAQRGLHVTGVDHSERCLTCVRYFAQRYGPHIDHRIDRISTLCSSSSLASSLGACALDSSRG